MLYALAVGAGRDDLDLTTENSTGVELSALPSFAAVLGGGSADLKPRLGTWDPSRTVHGTQLVELHSPLPAAGTISVTASVGAIVDKRSGGLIEVVSTAVDAESAQPLFTSYAGLFIRGEGGFGETGSTPRGLPVLEVGDREPDNTFTVRTSPDQALLYRLCGDRNPLHSDPAFARRAGFDQPILHGLCTWGIAARVLGRGMLGGRFDRVSRFGGRFSSPVTPGEELAVDAWRVSDLDIAFRVRVKDRVVIAGGVISERGR